MASAVRRDHGRAAGSGCRGCGTFSEIYTGRKDGLTGNILKICRKNRNRWDVPWYDVVSGDILFNRKFPAVRLEMLQGASNPLIHSQKSC